MKKRLVLAFCRLGLAGCSPKAPGTVGTALACVLAPFCFIPLSISGRCSVLIAIFVLGALAATRAEKILGQKDPGQVVIDELVGVWLVLTPISAPTVWEYFGAFVLFRIFDIAKPWPVKSSENWLPDGWGIMIDDVVAGCWALLCLEACRTLM